MDLLKIFKIEQIQCIHDSSLFCPSIFEELIFANFRIVQNSRN